MMMYDDDNITAGKYYTIGKTLISEAKTRCFDDCVLLQIPSNKLFCHKLNSSENFLQHLLIPIGPGIYLTIVNTDLFSFSLSH